jgi:hypothetical protein
MADKPAVPVQKIKVFTALADHDASLAKEDQIHGDHRARDTKEHGKMRRAALDGGRIAGDARKGIEDQTQRSIISRGCDLPGIGTDRREDKHPYGGSSETTRHTNDLSRRCWVSPPCARLSPGLTQPTNGWRFVAQ